MTRSGTVLYFISGLCIIYLSHTEVAQRSRYHCSYIYMHVYESAFRYSFIYCGQQQWHTFIHILEFYTSRLETVILKECVCEQYLYSDIEITSRSRYYSTYINEHTHIYVYIIHFLIHSALDGALSRSELYIYKIYTS